MSGHSTIPLKNIFNSANTLNRHPQDSTPDVTEGKRMMAAKIASSVGSGGAPIKVINAFLQVKDYTGLDRYLSKHMIPSDILTSALQKSCMVADEESVEILAKHGANVNFVDQFGTTLLHFAMRGGGNESVIVSLLSHGMEYGSWRSDGMPLLHWACSRGQAKLVEHIVESRRNAVQEPDQNGRLAIHVAAVFGQPEILSYLIQAVSKRINIQNVPLQFREDLEDVNNEDENAKLSPRPEYNISQHSNRSSARSGDDGHIRKGDTHRHSFCTPQTIAAANYLDQHQWTPLHHASCEEAVHLYQECLKILLDHGADPMLPTPQGKTALDLAYGAGRSQVLVDVLPKSLLIALLMRIDDIVPPHVRNKRKQVKKDIAQIRALFLDHTSKGVCSPGFENHSPFYNETDERSRKGHSILRRMAENMDTGSNGSPAVGVGEKGTKSDAVNIMSIWRKILLNDSVELLETLRDSLVWREKKPDSNVLQFGNEDLTATADFDAAQKLTKKQMSELFSDCYENGNGVYSYVQSKFQQVIKVGNFRSVLRSMTGLHTFSTLSTNRLVIHRPLYKSLLFLAVLCGRFRVSEQLLRMRQFDILPAAVIVALILRRLRKEPSFPQQMCNELMRYTERIEAIGVDVLNLVFMKDNTPEKMTCRNALRIPLRAFGNIPLIDLCARAKCTQLLSLPCSQRLLDDRWSGVLTHVPIWIRWPAKLVPVFGIFYLEYKDCQDRRKYQQQISSALASISFNRGTDDHIASNHSIPRETIKLFNTNQCCRCFGESDNRTVPIEDSVMVMQRVFLEKVKKRVSIYDQIVNDSSWRNLPRLYFMRMVYQSPSTKFFYHTLLHLLFLFCFSLNCLRIGRFRKAILAYTIGYALEELRQFIRSFSRDGWKEYFHDVWNWIDMLAVSSALTAYIMGKREETRDRWVQRNLYLISLTMFYVRTLFITSFSKNIGPRLKMMSDMIRKDLVPLLVVIVIFLLSFGVWLQGIIHPNGLYTTQNGDGYVQETDVPRSLKDLFRRAYYNIFDLELIIQEEKEEKFNSIIHFVMILYTGIVNVSLMNLLIALFSSTVSRISQESTAHWMASRYKMVKEYDERSAIPPPFNIISIAFEVIYFIGCKTYQILIAYCKRQKKPFEKRPANDQEDDNDASFGKTISSHRAARNVFFNEEDGKIPSASELEVVFDYILAQSFALRDQRLNLGLKWTQSEGTANRSEQTKWTKRPTDQTKTRMNLLLALKPIEKRLQLLEASVDHVMHTVERMRIDREKGNCI